MPSLHTKKVQVIIPLALLVYHNHFPKRTLVPKGTMSQFGKCNSNRFKVVIRKAIGSVLYAKLGINFELAILFFVITIMLVYKGQNMRRQLLPLFFQPLKTAQRKGSALLLTQPSILNRIFIKKPIGVAT